MEEANQPKKNWTLNQEAFNSLMTLLDADSEKAGLMYEKLRNKLVKYFEWMNAETPESLADETLDRVARKIYEGAAIYNLEGYVYSVARMILFEFRRKESKEVVAHSEYNSSLHSAPETQSQTLSCLHRCLAELPSEEREIIVSYYEEEKREKINSRKELAEGLGISLTALRVRVCRLRAQLEICLNSCLQQTAGEK